jgi:hypothetical protein
LGLARKAAALMSEVINLLGCRRSPAGRKLPSHYRVSSPA